MPYIPHIHILLTHMHAHICKHTNKKSHTHTHTHTHTHRKQNERITSNYRNSLIHTPMYTYTYISKSTHVKTYQQTPIYLYSEYISNGKSSSL